MALVASEEGERDDCPRPGDAAGRRPLPAMRAPGPGRPACRPGEAGPCGVGLQPAAPRHQPEQAALPPAHEPQRYGVNSRKAHAPPHLRGFTPRARPPTPAVFFPACHLLRGLASPGTLRRCPDPPRSSLCSCFRAEPEQSVESPSSRPSSTQGSDVGSSSLPPPGDWLVQVPPDPRWAGVLPGRAVGVGVPGGDSGSCWLRA